MGKVIAVAMNKGGIGKTSLISNIGGLLGQQGSKVLIVDMDGQGNQSLSFGINPEEIENTVYDVLMGDKEIKNVIVKLPNNIHLIPANADMDFWDIDILTDINKYPNPFEILKAAITNIKNEYDYILIDTPPSMGLVVSNVLVAADDILIPFVPELYAVKGLIRVVNMVDDFKTKYNPNLKVMGIVSMMVEKQTNLHSMMQQQAQDYCDRKELKLFDTVIPKSIKFATVTAYEGVPAVWGSVKNDAVKAYTNLVEEIKEID